MKKLLTLALALVLCLTALCAVAEPLELTMYFPVNVGGSAAQLIDNMTNEFNTQNPTSRFPLFTPATTMIPSPPSRAT